MVDRFEQVVPAADVSLDELLGAAGLPDFDPSDGVESAVIRGIVRSWSHRATVKKAEPDLDDLFDPAKADFPETLIPFHDHDIYLALDEETKDRIRAWAWIAYNKNVMDMERFVVNPGFSLVSQDAFGIGLSDTMITATMQAMVDEQYHTLMHLNASALTRKHRGWNLRERVLPHSLTVRRHQSAVGASSDLRAAALTRLAFTAVAETSISAYLGLMTESVTIQPVNRATVALHRRDELCHSSITEDLLEQVYTQLGSGDRKILVSGLSEGVDAFTAHDFTTWTAILLAEKVDGAEAMVGDVVSRDTRKRLVQDCSAIRRLCEQLGVVDEIAFDW